MEKYATEKDSSLPNISFCAPWKKESHSGLERVRAGENFQFWLNYSIPLGHLQYSFNLQWDNNMKEQITCTLTIELKTMPDKL